MSSAESSPAVPSWLRTNAGYLVTAAAYCLIVYLLAGNLKPSLLRLPKPALVGKDGSPDSSNHGDAATDGIIGQPKTLNGSAYGEWLAVHDQYVQEITYFKQQEQVAPLGPAFAHGGKSSDPVHPVEVVLYGDSITETWRGKQMGQEVEKVATGPPIWDTHAVTWPFRAASYGVAGDTSQNLLWRIAHGESPAGLGTKVVVLLIGTNDLTHSFPAEALDAPQETGRELSQRIVEIVEYLQGAVPELEVIVMGILPRGDRMAPDPAKLPSKFSPAIDETNRALERYCADVKHVLYVDCSDPFVVKAKGGTSINTVNMPDILHPVGPGLEELLDCWVPPAKRLVAKASA